MVKQKDAVFAAIVAVKGTSEFVGAVTLSKDERQTVSASLFQGFQAGSIVFSGETSTDSKLNAYVSGLVSNWIRKDSRLNGNVVYSPRNPGSRTGSGDEALKAMRTLLSTMTDEADKSEIQSAINQRQAELKPKKVINVAALPETLRHLAQ